MPITTIKHPLAEDVLTRLRDKNTNHAEYQSLSKPLAMLLAMYATQDLHTKRINITTPMCDTHGHIIAQPLVLIPILRAGLSMLAATQELFPNARTGFIGLERTDSKLEPKKYYLNIPQDPSASVLILDPMVATGGSAYAAIKHLKNLEFTDIRLISFLMAPEGVKLLESKSPDTKIFTASIDEKLDNNKYIIPGLGDFGDRLFGTLHQKG